ncbi:Tyrosine-protein kinase receptor old-1 [Caenorhabditis elegans]|uniref:Tyrosine-protein kinase receptor old-1 n=1 Tax=Caenorhabditis elegans TaxID=6239 RepID=OLD1_CAEEL|nr:Tyrosine-protein kinase receptor old-1 [Caenorhabditis elegans]Q17833.3 RecName: Full=Tyrosine-protein kinase receptor old-1; AltName: Full=Overexpression longevity determinant protein 1; Flags: Precursor [Caenorhabditis elegans]CAA91146.3 Tyrosine-protein kinase receptor old-1 [Caenorhabditis elegans]|eukprot:NP_496130.2 Tyrosine-protein kinase receptor old-1 [Caenorhabditis elegans]
MKGTLIFVVFYSSYGFAHCNTILRSSSLSRNFEDSLRRIPRSTDKDETGFEDSNVQEVIFILLYCLFVALAILICGLIIFYNSRKRELRANRSRGDEYLLEPTSADHKRRNSSNIVPPEPTPYPITSGESDLRQTPSRLSNVECPPELELAPINEKIMYLHYYAEVEINEEDLDISKGRPLGSGEFGIIRKGFLRSKNSKNEEKESRLEVAVKLPLNEYNQIQQELIYDELKVMCAVGKHPNILALVGGITFGERKMIVSEFVENGDLLSFLRDNRIYFTNDQWTLETEQDSLSLVDLLSFAFQIAKGMEYLIHVPCVHRDLALRNVLIKKNRIIRIADFGLARRHKNKDYYKTQSVDTPLPIHWMAPESIDKLLFTQKSDVWSYGVCLYELFSLGKSPYENVIKYDQRDFYWKYVLSYLNEGKRLAQPAHADAEIYNVMKLCWDLDMNSRTTFLDCIEFFEKELKTTSNEYFLDLTRKLRSETNNQLRLSNWLSDEKHCDS